MDRRILEYLLKVLFKDWRAFEGVGGIVVSATAFFIPDTSFSQKIKIFIIGLIVLFFIKLLKQFYKYFMDYNHPIRVIRKVQGDGGYSGIDIIVMDTHELVESGMLMTLFCNSSGAEQPICILEVISNVRAQEIIAKQLIPPPDKYSINKYFEEESRKNSLYAKTVVNSNIINLLES